MQVLYEHSDAARFISYDQRIDASLLKKCIDECDSLLDVRPPVVVYGKICNQNRNVRFFSNDSVGYKYAGSIAESAPLTPALEELLGEINGRYGTEFNGILVNKYVDGNDYIGSHSDDERGLAPGVGVLMVCAGAERKFVLRTRDGAKVFETMTRPGIVYQMYGADFQRELKHDVPKSVRVKLPRWSFTFRQHVE